MASYVKAQTPELLYQQSPKIVDAVVERRPIRIFPKNRTANSTDTIEFEFQNDQLVDLSTAVVHFDLQLYSAANQTTAVTDTSMGIANAMDVVRTMETFYNDVSVSRVQDANAWGNTFLSYSADRDWVDSAGAMMLGLYNPASMFAGSQFGTVTNGPTSAAVTHNRTRLSTAAGLNKGYSVPLCYLDGFFRAKQWLPMLGNKLRIQLTLETDSQVITYQTAAATGSYQLQNISMMIDTIIVERSYSNALIDAQQTDTGFRFPFTAQQTARSAPTAATDQYFQISNTTSNALSLMMLHSPEVAKSAWVTLQPQMHKQSFPINNFSLLTVQCGTRQLTPNDGIKTYPELYLSALKCVNGPISIAGAGTVSYKQFTDTYTQAAAATPLNSGAYGLCLLAVNLEKSLLADDEIMNSGLNSRENGGTNYFDVHIQTSSNTWLTTSSILTNIIHKRALVFRQGGVTIEF